MVDPRADQRPRLDGRNRYRAMLRGGQLREDLQFNPGAPILNGGSLSEEARNQASRQGIPSDLAGQMPAGSSGKGPANDGGVPGKPFTEGEDGSTPRPEVLSPAPGFPWGSVPSAEDVPEGPMKTTQRDVPTRAMSGSAG